MIDIAAHRQYRRHYDALRSQGFTPQEARDDVPLALRRRYLDHLRSTRHLRSGSPLIVPKVDLRPIRDPAFSKVAYLTWLKEQQQETKRLASKDLANYQFELVLLENGEVFNVKHFVAWSSIKPFKIKRRKVTQAPSFEPIDARK